jgi:hypothetical protein
MTDEIDSDRVDAEFRARQAGRRAAVTRHDARRRAQENARELESVQADLLAALVADAAQLSLLDTSPDGTIAVRLPAQVVHRALRAAARAGL